MITKNKLIAIWVRYIDRHHAPEKYKDLFSVNEFMRIIQGSFMTENERNIYCDMLVNKQQTACVYCSNSFKDDYTLIEWTDDFWNKMLTHFIDRRLSEKSSYYYDKIIDGVMCILEKKINKYSLDELPKEFKRFYNNTQYGYFNLPHIIDIVYTLNLQDKFYSKINSHTGFNPEKDVKQFDLNNWTKYFKASKHITTLKDSVSKDGIFLDLNCLPKYDDGDLDHYKIKEQYFPYAEDIAIIHNVLGKYISLRKVNTGAGYIKELVQDYGWLAGFYNEYPIYKVNTIQGFSFYIIKGNAYIDDVYIKKITFNSAKPENLNLDKEKRIFIVYNTKTGYWKLPKLNYPVKFKQFVKDILQKHKDTIGNWCDTTVFANSRTLNGNNSANIDEYPDVKSEEEFIPIVSKILERKANYRLDRRFKELGIKLKIELDLSKYIETIKPFNCIIQEDINSYVNNDELFTYKIEKYNII